MTCLGPIISHLGDIVPEKDRVDPKPKAISLISISLTNINSLARLNSPWFHYCPQKFFWIGSPF